MKNCTERHWIFGAINTLEHLEYGRADCGQGKGHTGTCQVKAALNQLVQARIPTFRFICLTSFQSIYPWNRCLAASLSSPPFYQEEEKRTAPVISPSHRLNWDMGLQPLPGGPLRWGGQMSVGQHLTYPWVFLLPPRAQSGLGRREIHVSRDSWAESCVLGSDGACVEPY